MWDAHTAIPKTPQRGGFSLVEVALALLVVAIGLTAIMGLFPAGMRSSRTAIEETEMGEFADFVFATLEVIAERDWSRLSNGAGGLGHAAVQNIVETRIMGPNPPAALRPQLRVRSEGPNLYLWRPANTEMHTPRPGTQISDVLAGQIVTRFTYTLDIQPMGVNELKYARLEVWPGDLSNLDPNDLPDGMLFYREYRRTN